MANTIHYAKLGVEIQRCINEEKQKQKTQSSRNETIRKQNKAATSLPNTRPVSTFFKKSPFMWNSNKVKF